MDLYNYTGLRCLLKQQRNMPIYTYKCTNPGCEHTYDKLVRMADGDKPQACPKCQEEGKRQLTAPGGFDLKGGGYYVTDFR